MIMSIFQWLGNNYEWLSSLLAIFIGIFTLHEIRKERIISYRPKITPIEQDYFLQASQGYLGSIWNEDYEDDALLSIFPAVNSFDIKFRNVGLGPALDITFTWNFNIEYIKNYFKKWATENNAYLTYDDIKSMLCIHNENGSLQFYYPFDDDSRIFIEKRLFMMSGVEAKPIGMDVPEKYALYLSLMAYIDIFKNYETKCYSITPLNLHISTRDSGNIVFEEYYQFNFSFSNIQGGQHEKANYALCKINIQKTKHG
ncbi:MAG: hypothetical protein JEY71_11885 [Sphaerochaeta sp.]|nr:hypothetical protein [Sphaerochaeta sp.]